MKTYNVKASEIERGWHRLDAEGESLGRLASKAAQLLRGKHKPNYSPHLDSGDYVVVVNAAKVRVSGKKMDQKIYYRHSGYPGGLRAFTFEEMMQRDPTRVIRLAVWGMLPHNRLGRAMFRKLKVYAGGEHPHQAQLRPGLGDS